MSRLWIVFISSLGVAGVVALCVYLDAGRKQVKNQRLQENLRLAGLQTSEIPSKPAGPTGKVEVDQRDFDFGTVSFQTKVSHRFKIRNTGQGKLHLKVKDRSCTCILGELAKQELAPGEETELELSVNLEGKEARIIQGVTLETSDPQRPQLALRLLGQLRREVWSDREGLSFAGLMPNEVRTIGVPVYSQWPEGFSIEKVVSRPAELELDTEPMTPAALSDTEAASGVLLKVTCPADVEDFFAGVLTCRVRRNGSAQEETYEFAVDGGRLGLIGIFGPHVDELGRIQLRSIEQGTGRTITFSVKARGREKILRVREIRAVPDFLRVSITPQPGAAESGLHKLSVCIPAGAPEGSFQGTNAGRIDIELEEYPFLSLKIEFAVVNDVLPSLSTVR